MSRARALRLAALAGVALLAALGALALSRARDDSEPTAAAPQVRWETTPVAVFGADRLGQQTACGVTLTEQTVGVAHAVLPCGVRLLVERDGRRVEVQVVERTAVPADRTFDVTAALAEQLGIPDGGEVRWRFAG
jgi:rare lipoprotein A (peptidoglycan hydrolase)